MLNGDKRECYAITEKGAGSDVEGSINTTAELVDDDYIIKVKNGMLLVLTKQTSFFFKQKFTKVKTKGVMHYLF